MNISSKSYYDSYNEYYLVNYLYKIKFTILEFTFLWPKNRKYWKIK